MKIHKELILVDKNSHILNLLLDQVWYQDRYPEHNIERPVAVFLIGLHAAYRCMRHFFSVPRSELFFHQSESGQTYHELRYYFQRLVF